MLKLYIHDSDVELTSYYHYAYSFCSYVIMVIQKFLNDTFKISGKFLHCEARSAEVKLLPTNNNRETVVVCLELLHLSTLSEVIRKFVFNFELENS